MKNEKPTYKLARVEPTCAQEPAEIVPIGLEPIEATIDRRSFLSSGISATAALVFLSACNNSPTQEPSQIRAPNGSIRAFGRGGGVILAISDDGNLSSLSKDGQIFKTWSLHTGQLLQTGKGQL